MSTFDRSDPAYPITTDQEMDGSSYTGLTKREELLFRLAQGQISHPKSCGDIDADWLIQKANEICDKLEGENENE